MYHLLQTSGSNPTCTACPAGYYCQYSAGGNIQLPCPAGTYTFTTATGLSSASQCQACDAGYYCTQTASFTNDQFVCGGNGQYYCPARSSAPVNATPGYYTAPLAAPAYLRSTQLPCPLNRLCASGVILPGIDFSASCPGGSATMQIAEACTS